MNQYDNTVRQLMPRETSGNPYDDAVQRLAGVQRAEITGAEMEVDGIAPDQFARGRQLADQTGMPPMVAARELPTIEDERERERFRQLTGGSPTLARWLSKPENMGIAKDDVEQLSHLEGIWKNLMAGVETGARIPRSLTQGAVEDFGGRALTGAGELLEIAQRRTSPTGQTLNDQLQDFVALVNPEVRALQTADPTLYAQYRDKVRDWSAPESWLRSGGGGLAAVGQAVGVPQDEQGLPEAISRGVGQVGGQLAAAPLGLTVQGLALASQGASIQAESVEAAGVTGTAAGDAAVVAGAAVTGITERLGLDFLMRKLPPGVQGALRKRLTDTLLSGAGEATQEVVEGLGQDLVEYQFYNPDVNIGEGWEDDATVGGAVGFIVRALTHVRARGVEVRDSIEDAKRIEEITAAAAASKVGKRYPQALEDFIRQARADGQPIPDAVYLDAAAVGRFFFQQGQDPAAEMARLAGDAEAAAEAGVTGDLRVSMERWAAYIAQRPDAAELNKHARLDPERMTAAEADAIDINDMLAQIYGGTEAAAARAEASAQEQDAAERVRADLVGQLTAAGTDRSTAELQAQVLANRYQTRAERRGLGESAWDVYAMSGLTIDRETPAVRRLRTQVEQFDTTIDPLIDAVRTGKMPDDRAVFGTSLVSALVRAGGLRDTGGDLRSRGALRLRPGLVSQNGMGLDDALTWARERGYVSFDENAVDESAFFDLIDAELSGGERTYSDDLINQRMAGFRTAVEDLARELERLGIDPATATNEQVKQALGLQAAGGRAFDQGQGAPVDQTQTPEFRAWFRDSKIVGENGRPLVLFHGTTGDFDAFEVRRGTGEESFYGRGVYATANPDLASQYAGGDSGGIGGNVMPVFASLQNPYFWPSGREPATDLEAAQALTEELQAQGYDGVVVGADFGDTPDQMRFSEVIVFDPTGVKSATGNRGGFDLADSRVLFQRGESAPSGQELVAIHNLSAENLIFADQLGGLAVPSIGITKAGTQFRGFGDITLIGTADMATPSAENPVFSADAYTQRFPDLVWAKVPSKKANAFVDSFGESYDERDTDQFWDELVNSPDRDRAIEQARRSGTMMRAWLRDQGQEPAARVMEERRPPSSAPWAGRPEFTAKLEELESRGVDVRNMRDSDPEWDELSEAAILAIEAESQGYAEAAPDLVDSMRETMLRGFDNGVMPFGPGDRAIMFYVNRNRAPSESRGQTVRALESQIGDRKPEFDQWVAEKIASLFAPPKIRLRGKNVDMTLANVVDAMTAGRGVVGKEKTNTFGGGKVRAANAKQFQTLDEIQQARDQVVSPDAERSAVEESERIASAYRDAALQFFTETDYRGRVDTWAGLDASMKALADAAKKSATQANVRAAMQKNGFRGMDAETVEAGVRALQTIRQTVVDYFEAKPQRAVRLSEFAGAVIPSNAPDQVRDALRRAGVPVVEYDRAEDDGRRAAVERFSRDLNAQTGRVLFQQSGASPEPTKVERGRIEFRTDGGARIVLTENANLSTFLHETGHLWLEELITDATTPGANPELMADLQTVLRWMGIEAGAPPVKPGMVRLYHGGQLGGADVEGAVFFARSYDYARAYADRSGDAGRVFFVDVDAGVLGEDLDAGIVGRSTVELQADQVRGMRQYVPMTAESVRAAVQTEQHEQWARGFEAYLREGKAPSSVLRQAFSRFRAWLLRLYRDVRALRVELSDDVRAVMDRLIATDAEIDEAQAANGYEAFADPEQARQLGMTDAEWQEYARLMEAATREAREDVEQSLLRSWSREQQDYYRQERARMRETVEADVNERPAYRAMLNLFSPDGIKLDKADLVERYGDAFLARLPGPGDGRRNRGPYVYTLQGGTGLDQAAFLLGFDSGDALVQALVNAESRRDVIEAETDARMRDFYPDPMTDGTMAEKAQRAVHNGGRIEVIERELQVIARAAGQRAQQARVIRALAERIIGRQKIRALRPRDYLVAERKAAREAVEAIAKGQFDIAYRAKYRQALNARLYALASEASDNVEGARTYLRKFETTAKRQKLGKAGGTWLDQIDALIDAHDLKRVSNVELDRVAALRELDAAAASGLITVPPELRARLEDSRRVNWRELTVEELLALRDTVRNIDSVAMRELEMIIDGQVRDLDADADAVAASILSANDEVPANLGSQSRSQLLAKWGRDALAIWNRPSDAVRNIEGEGRGPLMQRTIEVIRRAVSSMLEPMKAKAREDLAAMYQRHYSRAELVKMAKFRTRVPGVNQDWTRFDLLALALNWGNADNRAAVLDSTANGRKMFNEAGVNQALQTLDARDWKFVQDVWDYVDSFWPQVSAAQKRRTGLSPKKVEAAPVTVQTRDGQTVEVRGGYYPLSYDAGSSPAAAQSDLEDIFNRVKAGGFSRAATSRGHTIERVGSGGRPVRMDINVLHSHVDQVIHDLALGDAVEYVWKVLNHGTVKAAFGSVGKLESHKWLNLWLKDAAAGEMGARSVVDSAFRWIRVGFTKSRLGFNLVTAALQPTGFLQSAVVVGKANMIRGMTSFLSSPREAYRQVMDRSDFMRTRYELSAWNKDVQDTMTALRGKHGLLPSWIGPAMFYAMQKTQVTVDVSTWLGAYNRGLQDYNGDDAAAATYADGVVEQAQTSGFFSDRSAIERGTLSETTRQSEFVRSWTTLISYMQAKGNIAYTRVRQTDFRSVPQVTNLVGDMAMLFTVEALLVAMIRGAWPDEEDSWLLWLGQESVYSVLGGIPFIRELSSAAKGFDVTGTPQAGLLNDTGKAWTQIQQGEVDAAMLKALNNVGGTLFHYPSSQMNRAIDAYWRENVEGEDVAPLEYVTGRRGPPQ